MSKPSFGAINSHLNSEQRKDIFFSILQTKTLLEYPDVEVFADSRRIETHYQYKSR